MPRFRRRFCHLVVLGLSLLQPACGAGWRATALEPDPVVPPHQYFQFWIAGHSYALRRVLVRPDSISGIPFPKSADCSACRVSYPRANIDSIRIGNPDAGVARGVVIGAAALLAVTLALCSRGVCDAD